MTGDDDDATDGSTSICVDEQFAPIRYHWYPRHGETFAEALREMLADSGLSEVAQSQVFVDVAGKMRGLVRGQLRPVLHVKGPVASVTGIDVFEVRVRSQIGDEDGADVLVRIYHAEPLKLQTTEGSTVIGLHMHIKDISDPAQVRARQNAELQQARSRYFEGRPSNWE